MFEVQRDSAFIFFPCFDPYVVATAMFKEMSSEGQRVVERFFRGD